VDDELLRRKRTAATTQPMTDKDERFGALRKEVFEWSVENFGEEQPAEFPLIGAGEEAGELTTSVLKRAQGIDDAEKYEGEVGDEAEKDAIGDVAIYLADFVERFHSDEAELPNRDVMVLLEVYASIGYLNAVVTSGDASTMVVDEAVQSVLDALERLCEERGFDFAEIMDETWEEVSGREWDSEVETNESE